MLRRRHGKRAVGLRRERRAPGEQKQEQPGDAKQEPKGQQPKPEPGEEGAAEKASSLSKQDAERLLDALRARERKLPQDPRRGRRSGRTDVDRDW